MFYPFTSASRLLALLFCLLTPAAALPGVARAEESKPVWELAQPRQRVAGARRYGDVIVRNVHPHPWPGRTPDPYDTMRMLADFHVTRLEWTYQLDANFVKRLKAMGLTVGGAIEDDPGSKTKLGRVIGKDGQFATHRWFPKDRLVGFANAPEFRAAWLAEAKCNVDAGVDLMQQDDPQMAARTNPPYCYCKYCQEAFVKYQSQHGADSDYQQFQRDSILAFHLEMHRQLDAYAGRHVPFSHNSIVFFRGEPDWTAPAFDFINAEIDATQGRPEKFLAAVAVSQVPMVLTYRDTSVENNRRLIALSYATGTWMMMPWDVYMPDNAPRYFGKAEEYADLSAFVRASAKYLDGYEAAAAARPHAAKSSPQRAEPFTIEAGSGDLYALVRAQPGNSHAPVVIHLIDYAKDPAPCRLKLKTSAFGPGALQAVLRVPKPYDAAQHEQSQRTGDFSSLVNETAIPVTRSGEESIIEMPAVQPWGMLVITGK